MRYLGGKSRLAKHIARIIERDGSNATAYYEPFCGSAVVALQLHLQGWRKPIHLSDLPHVAVLLAGLKAGNTLPECVTEVEYEKFKYEPESFLRSFAGFGCSFGGRFFRGYARSLGRNYAAESRRSLMKLVPMLAVASVRGCDYRDIELCENAIVYCDPPYADTEPYSKIPPFRHDEFWEWAQQLPASVNVLVSEYQSPEGWETVAEFSHQTSICKDQPALARTERIFKRIKK